MKKNQLKRHKLICVQPFFDQIKTGVKTFELRRNDRDFQVGDWVYLHEYDMLQDVYSGQSIRVEITYVLENRAGLDDDMCIFSFVVLEHISAKKDKCH